MGAAQDGDEPGAKRPTRDVRVRQRPMGVAAAAGALIILASCGSQTSQDSGGQQGSAAVTPAFRYCDAARLFPTALQPVQGDVTVNDIALRQHQTLQMYQAVPAALRDDFQTVLTAYDEYMDAVAGDSAPAGLDVVHTSAFQNALAEIARYSLATCGGRDPGAASRYHGG